MSNIFYNIISILLGGILIYYAITSLKVNKKSFTIALLIHSVLFLTFGIGGFFLPAEYEYLTVLGMLAFCITAVICFVLNKKPKTNK